MQLAPAVGVVKESVPAPLSPCGTVKPKVKLSHTPSWIVPVVVKSCVPHTLAPSMVTLTTSLDVDQEPPDARKVSEYDSPASNVPASVCWMPPKFVVTAQPPEMW